MAYAVGQDLLDRYGADELLQLTDHTGSGAIDQTALTRAIADADEMIDCYLASRYRLPLRPVPPLVIKWACDLARYFLWGRGLASDYPAIVAAGHADAIAALKAAAAGTLILQVGGIEEPSQPGAQAIGRSSPRVLTRESTADFRDGRRLY